MKKVYVTGSAGLVGSRFVELAGNDFKILSPEIAEVDITNKSSLRSFLDNNQPDVVVNFAAFTDVTEAEKQKGDKNGSCWKVNIVGVENFVSLIDPAKTHFIQISTDMVFSEDEKDPGPYDENHPIEEDPSRMTWYGFTKKEAEKLVKKYLGEGFTVLRINYPVRARFDKKLDFIRKPLSLFDQGKLYPLFSDQQLSISFIDEVSQALKIIINNKICGIYHVSSKDTTTPFELTNYVIEKVRGVKNAVKSIKVDEFLKETKSPKVRYPKFGGLKVEKSEAELGVKYSTWKEIVEKLISQDLGS